MTQTKAQLVDLSVQGVNANNLSSGTVPDARFPAVLPAISGANLTSLPAANLTGTLPAINGSNLTSLPAANLTGTLPAISGANLTSLPAANLTGTLPAISGANLTNLPVDLSNLSATNLTSGTIPDARFPATLPAISGANLTNLPSSGISNVVEDTSPELGGNLDVLTSEIVTSTSNGNIKLAPNGSGAVEIKGDGSSYEGCLQLNCHVNSHGVKIKSPDHSAGQSYTMILPDNNITANKFLQVKSITGSGNTAVGQLEYADTFTGDVNFNGWATFNASILEKVVTATLGSAATLSPGTGGIQYLTLGQNCTITLSMATGQSFLVVITATSSGYSITWPTMRWAGGSAPTLGGATPTAIELWYDGNYYYGATVGDLS